MSKSRTEMWFALVGLILAAIPGFWMYLTATTETLHPDAKRVPSSAGTARIAMYAKAVEEGRTIVRASISEQNLPGLSVAVGIDGELVWTEGFGFADLEKRTPVQPSHQFRIGTASTILTSAAVGLLLEQNRLKLDDLIQVYVPEFPKKDWPVTLRQVLNHTAGVKNDSGDEGPLFGEHCGRPVEALQFFADSPLRYEPGTKDRYSSYGWILASAALEKVAKKPFLDFMRDQVFGPIGMNDTKADSLTEYIPQRVTFYFPRFGADPKYGLHLMRELDYSCYAGSSVFLSTASDLVRFGLAINGGRLLKIDTVRTLQTPETLTSGEVTRHGLGWDLDHISVAGQPRRTAGQTGQLLGGEIASVLTIPEEKAVVAVISNMSYADTSSITLKIAEAFLLERRTRR